MLTSELVPSVFLRGFWKECREIQFILKAVSDDDNGMLIFTQINTLHKTICIMLISRKVLIICCDLSFPSLILKRFGWEWKSLNWKNFSALLSEHVLIFVNKAGSASLYDILIISQEFQWVGAVRGDWVLGATLCSSWKDIHIWENRLWSGLAGWHTCCISAWQIPGGKI